MFFFHCCFCAFKLNANNFFITFFGFLVKNTIQTLKKHWILFWFKAKQSNDYVYTGNEKKIERCVWYCLLSHRGYLYIFSKTTFSLSASKRKCNGNERTEKKLHGKKSNLRDNTFWMLLERRANSVAQRETFCSFFHRIQSQRNIFFLCSLFGGDYDRVRMWCYFYGYFLLAVRIFDFPHSWNFIAQRHVIPFW